MKIPKKLKIGGHLVSVVFDSTRFETDDSGLSDRNKNEIVIDRHLAQSQQESTLIHEILHYINAPLDHALLDSLSEQLYQVLSDNDLLK